ncbi:NACHT and WD repeat domain-containing protein 2 [Lingula anatina]|uniref:NACHT and WD repeat domain-containing protein 2 n=1 Tax=Lingula anatina TaxID=7574 RepID=A0A1S3HCJ0_LINAN|nr:NACHT and WD repeat domain-containing protein 2 [Lingula anatina]|eukprot:XP_013383728.1 NACHT and WD repeat domain-containing protein 2 [Lingula anatina]
MGCGASTGTTGLAPGARSGYAPLGTKPASNFDFADIAKTWHALAKAEDFVKHGTKVNILPERRTGWKTVRIFVSSTFKDFNAEREVLVKEVFPDLRVWCQERRLHLVECDLRWGVPKNTSNELVLRTCLEEIDRCVKENTMPYFINMLSERVGWVVKDGDVPSNLLDHYRLFYGLSVTEMEIVHAAYKRINPNSIFMLRDTSFLQTMPTEHAKRFLDDSDDQAKHHQQKMTVLKGKIQERFPAERVLVYSAEYVGPDEKGKPRLKVSDTFKERVEDFFKERISEQYPMSALKEQTTDKYQLAHDAQEAFMKNKSEIVLGRDALVDQIIQYVAEGERDVPLLVLGEPGSGKSSVMARVADIIEDKAKLGEIKGGGGQQWHIFYHFVGAVPGSTDAEPMIHRLLKELGVITDDSQLPKDLESASQLCFSILSNTSTKPVVILIDALNQMDDDDPALNMLFVPPKLSPNVRCVFSMIPGTPQHKALMKRESQPKELPVQPLDMKAREEIVQTFFSTYNKQLDPSQFNLLMNKPSTNNPLWLSIALEELRVHGDFFTVTEKIKSLKEELPGLLSQVLERFEREAGGNLLIATLCMIEVSKGGLLESELLILLSDEENLMPPSSGAEKGARDAPEKRSAAQKGAARGQLSYFKWASVYRVLRPFLRPYGQSGEGRLDFYHRTLSKAIRQKYFNGQSEEGCDTNTKKLYRWWHSKLADFFLGLDNIERKEEELPFHLIELGDTNRLEKVLLDWAMFDRLYREDWSAQLHTYWRQVGDTDRMKTLYLEALHNMENSPDFDEARLALRYEKVARVLSQVGFFEEPKALAEKAMAMEETLLGKRPERMARLYNLMAKVWDEGVIKKYEFMYRSQLPDLNTCIEWYAKAIDAIKPLAVNSKELKSKWASDMSRITFHLSGWSLRGGNTQRSAQAALTDGKEYIKAAQQVFEELNDIGMLAETTMTEGLLCQSAVPEQLKLYEKAKTMCYQVYGEKCILASRIMTNTGIHYEELRDYLKAYDCFKKQAYLCVEIYGPKHPMTVRSMNTIREPMYRRIGAQLGDPPPPPAE